MSETLMPSEHLKPEKKQENIKLEESVAMNRTQFATDTKFKPQFFGP